MSDMLDLSAFKKVEPEVQKIVDVRDAVADATNDETPFLGLSEDEKPVVVGDPTKVNKEAHDYTITFEFPADSYDAKTFEEQGMKVEPKGDNLYVTATIKRKRLLPIDSARVIANFQTFLINFYKVANDGKLQLLEGKEIEEMIIYAMTKQKLLLAAYNFVAGFLGISDEMGSYMVGQSVLTALVEIITNEPDLVNEVDSQIK